MFRDKATDLEINMETLEEISKLALKCLQIRSDLQWIDLEISSLILQEF